MIADFRRALIRESHVLSVRPELTWQQLFNRLQWEREELAEALGPELSRRQSPGHSSWFRSRLRSIESGALVRTFSEESGIASGSTDGSRLRLVSGCALSPAGSLLASTGDDGRLRIWDVTTGEERARYGGGAETTGACAVMPDGCRVSVGELFGADEVRPLVLYDVETGERRMLGSHDGTIHACAVSADGRSVVSASSDRTVRVWDPASGKERTVLGEHDSKAFSCATSPDGELAASGDWRGSIKLWNLEERREVAVLAGHSGPVVCLVFGRDGGSLVSASFDGTVKHWDVVRGRHDPPVEKHAGVVFGCAFSPDGETVVSASADGTVRVWEMPGGRPLAVLRGHDGAVFACALDRASRIVASAGTDTTVRLWDLGGRPLGVLEGHRATVDSCAFSPDGAELATGDESGVVRTWDVERRATRRVLRGHAGVVWGCVYALDGSTLFTAATDRTLRAWDPVGGTEVAVLPLPARLYCLAHHPERPLLAVGDEAGSVHRLEFVGGAGIGRGHRREEGTKAPKGS